MSVLPLTEIDEAQESITDDRSAIGDPEEELDMPEKAQGGENKRPMLIVFGAAKKRFNKLFMKVVEIRETSFDLAVVKAKVWRFKYFPTSQGFHQQSAIVYQMADGFIEDNWRDFCFRKQKAEAEAEAKTEQEIRDAYSEMDDQSLIIMPE